MSAWRCCDCNKFVRLGVARCLECSADHGALRRWRDSNPMISPEVAIRSHSPLSKDETLEVLHIHSLLRGDS